MVDLQELQILAQLVDNLDKIADKLKDAYEKNNSEEFNNLTKGLLSTKLKISEMIQ